MSKVGKSRSVRSDVKKRTLADYKKYLKIIIPAIVLVIALIFASTYVYYNYYRVDLLGDRYNTSGDFKKASEYYKKSYEKNKEINMLMKLCSTLTKANEHKDAAHYYQILLDDSDYASSLQAREIEGIKKAFMKSLLKSSQSSKLRDYLKENLSSWGDKNPMSKEYAKYLIEFKNDVQREDFEYALNLCLDINKDTSGMLKDFVIDLNYTISNLYKELGDTANFEKYKKIADEKMEEYKKLEELKKQGK